MSKYTVAQGQQKEQILLIDGKQSICPYASPIPLQGNMGQIQIIRMPCSTLCPHAKVKTDRQGFVFSVGCSPIGEQEFKIDSSEPENVLVSV